MARTTNLNIRIDEDLKNDFSAFCEDVGMSMSTAISVFARKAVKEQRIPFEITGEIPNRKTLAAFDELDNGGGTHFSGSTDNLFDEILGGDDA